MFVCLPVDAACWLGWLLPFLCLIRREAIPACNMLFLAHVSIIILGLIWILESQFVFHFFMAQVVDLGIESFKQIHVGGQCMLSRATATLLLGDNRCKENSTSQPAVNPRNVWVTSKQELTVDLHIEAYLGSSIAVSSFVKEAVETVQNALIGCGSHLHISRSSHKYHSTADRVTIHASLILCDEPNQSPQILPGRVPRKVRGCAVDPHPPAGIARATLSHIVIHLKSPRNCTPWSLCLTRLWLKDLSSLPLLTNSDEEEKKNTHVVSLRPLDPSLLSPKSYHTSNTHTEDNRGYKQEDREFNKPFESSPRARESGRVDKSRSLNELLNCAILSLVSKPTRSTNDGVVKAALDNGPRLSEIAPILFRPSYYENIRQRTGLVPVVTKSIATIFRVSLTSKSTQRIPLVGKSLNSRYKVCTDTENEDHKSDFRSLIRCGVWTALQSGSYKVEQLKSTNSKTFSEIFSSDDCLLTEESDGGYNSGGDMLSSTTSSDAEDDGILSDEDQENQQDPGYCSLLSEKENLHSISGLDGYRSELVTQTDSDGGEFIFSSSSLAPRGASDIAMESDMTSDALSFPGPISQCDLCSDEHGETILDNSSSSVLTSTNHCAMENLDYDGNWASQFGNVPKTI